MTAPNGCAYCGQPERWHCQRYDGLHPAGRNGYTAPTDAVRLARMRTRRAPTPPATEETP